MFYRILELYSGIGGMHCAWKESGFDGEVIAAIDINQVANEVYQYNFPQTTLLTKNIQSLTACQINEMKVNIIMMSPPCQPFTRNGKFLDENDPRTNSFIYIIGILDQLQNISHILMENVKGFECSSVRKLFIEKLEQCGFEYQEFLLSPDSVGVPNSRLRYYCLARRKNTNWQFNRNDEIIHSLQEYVTPYKLEEIIEKNVPDDYLVPDKHLRHANVLDICFNTSQRSNCFTKAYSHYVHGTGSIYTDSTPEAVEECLKNANNYDVRSKEFTHTVKSLKLRFFTPNELLLLMSFPKSYTFPLTITTKQCYRLIGNSVNVKVISELVKVLLN